MNHVSRASKSLPTIEADSQCLVWLASKLLFDQADYKKHIKNHAIAKSPIKLTQSLVFMTHVIYNSSKPIKINTITRSNRCLQILVIYKRHQDHLSSTKTLPHVILKDKNTPCFPHLSPFPLSMIIIITVILPSIIQVLFVLIASKYLLKFYSILQATFLTGRMY